MSAIANVLKCHVGIGPKVQGEALVTQYCKRRRCNRVDAI